MLQESKLFKTLARPKTYFGLPVTYGIFMLGTCGLMFIFSDSAIVKFFVVPFVFVSMSAFGRIQTMKDEMWFDIVIKRITGLRETLFGGRYNA